MATLLTALPLFTLIAFFAGVALGIGSISGKNILPSLEDAIEEKLPQLQCGQCGYPGCRPYARAVAQKEAQITQCVPGGTTVIAQLAALLHSDPPPTTLQSSTPPVKKIAVIEESFCIGCTKCLHVCPVDAIVGTHKALHTVLTHFCTGCDLCVAACPTDCIQMVPTIQGVPTEITTEVIGG